MLRSIRKQKRKYRRAKKKQALAKQKSRMESKSKKQGPILYKAQDLLEDIESMGEYSFNQEMKRAEAEAIEISERIQDQLLGKKRNRIPRPIQTEYLDLPPPKIQKLPDLTQDDLDAIAELARIQDERECAVHQTAGTSYYESIDTITLDQIYNDDYKFLPPEQKIVVEEEPSIEESLGYMEPMSVSVYGRHEDYTTFEPKFTVEELEAVEIACIRDDVERETLSRIPEIVEAYRQTITGKYDEETEAKMLKDYEDLVVQDTKSMLDEDFYNGYSAEDIQRIAKNRGYTGKVELSHTQIQGIQFVLRKFLIGRGCIIAHEMGLGKTLLTLMVERIVGMQTGKPTLVIVPSGLAETWRSECIKYFGTSIKILFYEGRKKAWWSYSNRTGPKGAKHSTMVSLSDIKNHTIVLTHYQALTRQWTDVVRNKVCAKLKSLQDEINYYAQTRTETYRMALEEEFQDLDWERYYAYKKSLKPMNVRVFPDNRSTKFVGNILGYHWGMIVVDEAHRMGNHESILSEMCYAMKADYKLALSGTPTPNYTSELWSLFRFIEVPDLPNFKQFEIDSKHLTNCLIREGNRGKTRGRNVKGDIGSINDISQTIRSLRQKYDSPDYVMNSTERRVKTVLDMIEKWMQKITKNGLAQELKTSEELEEEANRYATQGWKLVSFSNDTIPPAYEKVITIDPYVVLVSIHESIRDAKRQEYSKLSGRDRNSFMTETITYLRLLVSHPTSLSKGILEKYCKENDIKTLISLECQKMQEFLKYYKEEVEPLKQKVIIFAQFKNTAQQIFKQLERLKINSVYIDGDIDKKSKDRICKNFSSSDYLSVMCCTHCIGLGYNIPGANHVVIWDQWWNIPEDQQGYSRTLRPGQLYDVKIVRLMYSQTVEESIYRIAQNKDKLNSALCSKNREVLMF